MKIKEINIKTLSIVIILILFNACSVMAQKAIEITSTNEEITIAEFENGVDILKERMDCANISISNKAVLKDQKAFQFELFDHKDIDVLKKLMSATGKFEIIALSDNVEQGNALMKDPVLQNLTKQIHNSGSDQIKYYTGELFFSTETNKAQVEKRIEELIQMNDWSLPKLAWSHGADSDGFFSIYMLNESVKIDGEYLKSISVEKNEYAENDYILRLKFDRKGKDLWAEMTKENLEKRLCFLIDGKVYFAPLVKSAITSGDSMITGDFSIAELDFLKCILSYPLPFSFK